MSEEIENLKQTEKEKLAGWQSEFATELDVTQIKAEEESVQVEDEDEEWPTWLAYMLIAFGLLALFAGVNIGFSGWWFLIFLVPWIWGKGGCSRNCWW
jgi:uncharacterized membrane-anchored protein